MIAALLATAGLSAEPVEAPAPAVAPLAPITAPALQEHLTATGTRTRVYNFWATWCGPCVAEMPELVAFAAARPDVDVVLVNLDMIGLRDTKVVPFLKKHAVSGVTALQLDDPDPATALHTAVDGWPDSVPVTLVVEANGQRRHTFTVAVDKAALEEAVGTPER